MMKILNIMILAIALSASAQQQWHANLGRNMVVEAKGLPAELKKENQLWTIPLKSGTVFTIPSIEAGKVFFALRGVPVEGFDRRDGGVLCVDLYSGKILWAGHIGPGGSYGVKDVPMIDGDRIYARGNDNILYCLDMSGKPLWTVDVSRDYFNAMHGPAGTGLVIGNQIWIPSGYGPGSDCGQWETNSLESPFHPHVVVFDKHSGKLIAQDSFDVGPFQHGQWSSLSSGVVNGRRLVFYGDGYGYLHALEVPEIDPDAIEKPVTLKEVWTCDANPHSYRYDEKGRRLPYGGVGACGPKDSGPCEIIAPPVFHGGKIYVTISRDVHYSIHRRNSDDPFAKYRYWGAGALTCIDPSGEGDITKTNKVWENTEINRTFCPPSITDGLIFVADHSGYVNCIDLADGKLLWKFDIEATKWNYFQMVADKKLYVSNERDDLFVLNATREGGLLYRMELDAKNTGAVGVTDGIVIVATHNSITAYKGPGYQPAR